MLKFSKINILITTLLSIIVIFFTISNFTEFEDEFVNQIDPIFQVTIGDSSRAVC